MTPWHCLTAAMPAWHIMQANQQATAQAGPSSSEAQVSVEADG